MPLIHQESPVPGCTLGVWRITESFEELNPSAFLAAEDLAVAGSFRNELRKRQWVACRKLLSELCGETHRILYDSEGKPYLERIPAHISLSHAGEFAAVIFSTEFRVGIDIELPRDRIFRVADRFLSPAEISRLPGEHRREALYVHWCAKEAAFKLHGRHGVDLQHDLIVEPFDYLCTGNGQGRITLNLRQEHMRVPFRYRVSDAFILVSAVERDDTT